MRPKTRTRTRTRPNLIFYVISVRTNIINTYIAYVTDTETEAAGTSQRMLANAALFFGTNFVIFFWATDMSDWMAAGLFLV